MDDRQLMEAAARAAGLDVVWNAGAGMFVILGNVPGWPQRFDPLGNDGVAFRLMVKLGIQPVRLAHIVVPKTMTAGNLWQFTERFADHGGDDLKATRRAIVRAAAGMAS